MKVFGGRRVSVRLHKPVSAFSLPSWFLSVDPPRSAYHYC